MYPKVFTHRDDHNSKVVIMNADQEAQLPAEYLPEGGARVSGETGGSAITLESDSTLMADREKLEQDRAEFAALVAAAQKDAAAQHQELAEGRAKLQADRDELTAGYKADKAKLDEDRATLDAEIEGWNKTKAGEQPAAIAPPSDPAPAAATATPAKRVRTAKAD